MAGAIRGTGTVARALRVQERRVTKGRHAVGPSRLPFLTLTTALEAPLLFVRWVPSTWNSLPPSRLMAP